MKVLVGISGGVDSAVCALRLIQLGYTVEAAVLRMHEYTETDACEAVAASLGVPLHVVDCTEPFDRIVKENLVREYSAGRTPNPCIICNERVKFAYLYSYALEHGFDFIATGHYARVERLDGRLTFRIAEDSRKDQSYMLYRLPQHILSRLLLPLADMTKTEVRAIAEKCGLSVADKPDSQEICFLPDGGYADFVESRAGSFAEGSFVSPDGRILGKHKGIIHYTVGQRKGLGIALGERAYVTDINPEENTVTLSSDFLGKTEIKVSSAVLSGFAPSDHEATVSVRVKLRYTAPLENAVATVYPDGTATLTFDRPVRSAPGQSAVAYDGEGRVLFGGYIDR